MFYPLMNTTKMTTKPIRCPNLVRNVQGLSIYVLTKFSNKPIQSIQQDLVSVYLLRCFFFSFLIYYFRERSKMIYLFFRNQTENCDPARVSNVSKRNGSNGSITSYSPFYLARGAASTRCSFN